MLPRRGVIRVTVPSPGLRCALQHTRQYPNLRKHLASSPSSPCRSYTNSSRGNHVFGISPRTRVVGPSGHPLSSRIGAAPAAAILVIPYQQTRNASWWNPLGYVYNPWGSSSSKPSSESPEATVRSAASSNVETSTTQSASESASEPASAASDAAGQATDTMASSAVDASQATAETGRQLSEEAAAEVARLSEHFSNPSTDFDVSSFQQSLLDLPEEIGFLNQLGLDFGWGPSSMMQWIIEHLYVWGGLPWWATLAVCGIAFRLAFFKITMDTQEASVRMMALTGHPKFKALQAEMADAMQRNDMPSMMKARQELIAMRRLTGASFRPMLLNFLNIPIGFGCFRVLRNMADIPVPSLESGGILWFTNLTIPDPYYILPLLSTVGIVALLKTAGPATSPSMRKMQNVMLYVITPITALVTLKFAAALQWFFCVTGIVSIVLNYLRLQPWFRASLGYDPEPPRAPQGGPNLASLLGMDKGSSKFIDASYQPPNPTHGGKGTPSNPTILPSAHDTLKNTPEAEEIAASATPTKKLLNRLGISEAADEFKSTYKNLVGKTEEKKEEKERKHKEKQRDEYDQRRAREDEDARKARMEAKRFRKQ